MTPLALRDRVSPQRDESAISSGHLAADFQKRLAKLAHGGPLAVRAACSVRRTAVRQQPDSSPARLLSPGASPARLAEFATGRMLARECMAAIGRRPELVGRGPMREPVWPDALRGSISHAEGLAVAVVWQPSDYSACAVGVDAERIGRFKQGLCTGIFTRSERDGLRAFSAGERDLNATGLFSIKEAIYKAQFAITSHFVDACEIEMSLAGFQPNALIETTLEIRCGGRAVASFGAAAFFRRYGNHVLAGAVLRTRNRGDV